MQENRTWEQMKSDNAGASWIMDNGEFCDKYKHEFNFTSGELNRSEIDFFNQEQKIVGWKQRGFNGCWSCDNMQNCKRYLTYLSR